MSETIGDGYLPFFKTNMQIIEQIYKNYLDLITKSFVEFKEPGLYTIKVKAYRQVRKNIISLLESIVKQSDAQFHK